MYLSDDWHGFDLERVEQNEGTDVLGSIYLSEYISKMIFRIVDKIITWCPFDLSILPHELFKIKTVRVIS